MKGEVCFIRGRLKFDKPGTKKASAPFPSVVVVFGLKLDGAASHIATVLETSRKKAGR